MVSLVVAVWTPLTVAACRFIADAFDVHPTGALECYGPAGCASAIETMHPSNPHHCAGLPGSGCEFDSRTFRKVTPAPDPRSDRGNGWRSFGSGGYICTTGQSCTQAHSATRRLADQQQRERVAEVAAMPTPPAATSTAAQPTAMPERQPQNQVIATDPETGTQTIRQSRGTTKARSVLRDQPVELIGSGHGAGRIDLNQPVSGSPYLRRAVQ